MFGYYKICHCSNWRLEESRIHGPDTETVTYPDRVGGSWVTVGESPIAIHWGFPLTVDTCCRRDIITSLPYLY